jgi:uncharacterized repeat protein (TIGR03943 family)
VTNGLQSLLLILLGGATLHASLTNTYLRYVKAELRPWLIITGILLVVLGAVTAWQHRNAGTDGHEHGHGAQPRVAFLLLLPVLVLVVLSPPPLGAFLASKSQPRPPKQVARPVQVDKPDGAPLTIDLSDYISAAVYDDGKGLADREIHMVGFATHSANGWDLTRMVMVCCAADAYPVHVHVEGAPPPPENTWVEVTGRYLPARRDPSLPATSTRAWTVLIEATSVQDIPVPDEPYERG